VTVFLDTGGDEKLQTREEEMVMKTEGEKILVTKGRDSGEKSDENSEEEVKE
jgi:hypothetical protein